MIKKTVKLLIVYVIASLITVIFSAVSTVYTGVTSDQVIKVLFMNGIVMMVGVIVVEILRKDKL